MRSDERRKHVRIRPLPELPVKVVRLDVEPPEPVAVYDISIGGLGLVTGGSLKTTARDQTVTLSIDVGRYGQFELPAKIRYVGITITGAELVDPPHAATSAFGRYLAELLERGAFS